MNKSDKTDQVNNSVETDVVSTYEIEGYVIVPNVLDMGLITEAREHLEQLQQRHPDLRPEQFGTGVIPMDAFWLRLVSDTRLLDIAEQFLGPNLALFATHYIAKPPRVGLPVLWHQDGSYWPLEPMNVVTFWLSMDDVDPGNGCLRVIPGTHKDALVTHDEYIPTTLSENVLNSAMDPSTVDESKARDIRLSPGDISIHNPNIVHGSNANESDRWRRGLTIRYISTSTRITDPDFTPPFLLRGKPLEGINDYASI